MSMVIRISRYCEHDLSREALTEVGIFGAVLITTSIEMGYPCGKRPFCATRGDGPSGWPGQGRQKAQQVARCSALDIHHPEGRSDG